MKRFSCFLQIFLLVGLYFGSAQHSWALRCLEGSKSTSMFDIDQAPNTTHTTQVDLIRVTNSNQAAGTLLWQSPSYSTTFTCYDDYARNAAENGYLYLDDNAKTLARAFKGTNLEIGIRYNGQEIPISNTTANTDTDRINTGYPALIPARSGSDVAHDNCTLISKQVKNFWGRPTRSCVNPQTITITYSLYIRSKGSGSNFESSAQNYQAFQLDGLLGRNFDNGNFQEKVTGINVTYIDCIPVLRTQDVDLGAYSAFQDIGPILRKTPFQISVATNGKDCTKYPFVGRFSSNQRYDNTTITASETGMKNVVGIKVYAANASTPIELGQNFDFGSSNGSTLTKNFEAGVFFLAKPSTAGQFSSTLNYEVYFK